MPTPTSDLVRLYLQDIGRFPLLTGSQEIAYARLVQQMVAIEQRKAELVQKLNREPTTSELAADLQKTERQQDKISEVVTAAPEGNVDLGYDGWYFFSWLVPYHC